MNKLLTISQIEIIRNIIGRQPLTSLNKIPHSEHTRFSLISRHRVPRPRHPPARVRTGAAVHILPVVKRRQREIPGPLQPPGRVHQIPYIRKHKNGPRVLLPRPAQVGLELRLDRNQVGRGRHLASQDRYTGVLERVLSALGGVQVLLILIGSAGVEVAVLEDDGGVAEDEVDGAVDVAVAVELAEGVDVEGVLVSDKAAVVEGGEVGAAAEGHGLVLAGPGVVLEGDASGYESVSYYSCRKIQ